MSAVDTFWHSGRLPLSLLFLAFMLTFVITRIITRLIRAGRGPFHNNVRGGVHIHHAVPGLVLLLVGAVMSVTVAGHRPGALIAAVLIGVGASLVLDEFALILHLGDVYWSTEGQLSVQVVSLTTAVLGLLALGVNPFDDTTAADNAQLHGNWGVLVVLPIHIACVLVCVDKGKYSTAAVGAFIPPVGWIGAIRLARPRSRWAGCRYSPAKKARAATRADSFDDRFGKWGLTIEDWVAGKPSSGPPPAAGPTM